MRDLRYALRGLRRQPLFTLVAVLTLAIGIGANTAIFSLLYQVLLRPLPYADADRLVFVWNSYPLGNLPQASVSIPDYLDRRADAPAIEDATLFTQRSVSLAEGGSPEQVRALRVTPSFFSTLGRAPMLGRAFAAGDDTIGADQFAILTYGLWNSRFAADDGVVGRDIRLDGVAYRVVGVLPPDLELPARDIALLVPFSFTPEQMSDQGRGSEFSAMIARLAPGATREQLDTQMKTIISRNLDRLPQFRGFAERSGFTGYSVPIREQIVGNVRAPLLLLQAGVVLVLLIACANVANLLLMRATGRHREVAIRTAIGAGRGHLVRQMLTEGLVLSLLGAVVGLGLGLAGVRGLVALIAQQLPHAPAVTLNGPMLAFALGMAVLTGMVFGLVPALATRKTNVNLVLRDDSARGSASRGTGVTRSGLVVAEVALAVMLLVAAGLLGKSYARLQDVDPGFSPENVLTAQLALSATSYPDATARATFWRRLVEDTSRIPGVVAAGLTSNVPFNGMVGSGSYSIVGYTPGPAEAAPHGRQEIVGGDYFRAMQIPLLKGRTFTDGDGPGSPPVVVIDDYLVSRYFRDQDPLGQQIRRGGPDSPPFTVVGVVGTINSIDLSEPVTKERIYYPVTQAPLPSMALVVKSTLDPESLVAQVRTAVQTIDPGQPMADVRSMDQWIGRSLSTRRAPTLLLGLFGAVALLLSGIGIYGVVAYGVTQRVREFGIRQALGADGQTIVRMVLRQGFRTAIAGVALGLVSAVALTRFLQSQLYGVGAYDPLVFVAAGGALLAASLVACYLPARGSTRTDPMVALRDS
ncbi:MAG: ABC transporter permease [Acidobacteria bacterium]|nr:ABC transporter permease [Acidobacteriota bacterium]